jgi:chaperonin GroES
MKRKDTLAAGARSAVFAGGVGDTDIYRNISKDTQEEAVPTFTAAPVAEAPRKRFRPLGTVMLVRQVDPEKQTPAGLIIIDDVAKKDVPAQGTVLAVGNKVVDIKVGEEIEFGKYAGTEFRLNGETLLLMREDEVLGILENEV